MITYTNDKSIKGIYTFIKDAMAGKQQDFTTGSIRKAVFMLDIIAAKDRPVDLRNKYALDDLIFRSQKPLS